MTQDEIRCFIGSMKRNKEASENAMGDPGSLRGILTQQIIHARALKGE